MTREGNFARIAIRRSRGFARQVPHARQVGMMPDRRTNKGGEE